MTDMEDLEHLMEAGDATAYGRPRRHRVLAALAPLLYRWHLQPLLYRCHLAVARLRAVRPLPAEPLGTIVIGHARFPVRTPITLDKGCFVISGTTLNPFNRKLDPSVSTYQLLDPDGVLVREGPVPDILLHTITTTGMSLTFTVSLKEARYGP